MKRMRKLKSRETAKKQLWIPIFCILLILYSILAGLPDKWLIWAFVAIFLDCAINPIYVRVEVEWIEEDE